MNWRKTEIAGKQNRKRKRRRRRGRKASAGGENKPFHAMLHLHTSTTGSCSAQFRLRAGCKAIGKARPNPTFPLPLEGQVLFPRVILSVEKCVVSSGRVVLFRYSAARGQIFPPIERGKKTASGGERRQQTHKRERGGLWGRATRTPQCLASRFGRMPLWESSGFLVILTSSPPGCARIRLLFCREHQNHT